MALHHEHEHAIHGGYLSEAGPVLTDLEKGDVVGRIWRRDHTVWKPEPTGIADRLGWLDVSEVMRSQIPDLTSFADEIRRAGFRHAVLLGMGGSSLGPEVLRQTLGSAEGYPELIVLDSTVPAWIRWVADSIDPARTLFLVSSKSGGSIEPNVFYKYFRRLIEEAGGGERAGENFVAITDPGTSLERLARAEGFRRVFSNPADIGGRYSVLSYFGMAPAAIAGADIASLLDRAGRMRDACGPRVPVPTNPAAALGAALGALAVKGRDKLTLLTSPSIGSFGLWAEQLIAESLGKEGKGIVPVAGEPPAAAESYGDDRLFVFLRLKGDDNTAVDQAVDRVDAAGHPVVRLTLRDARDLGAEFFRWELATAIAGAIIGVNPFDQPDVQAAKDMTDSVLGRYRATGALPASEGGDSFEDLLSQVRRGDYLAIMAYLPQTAMLDRAFDVLRRNIVAGYGIATTLGYGPRFLHSTGQLHKGGPASGAFLQITADHPQDLAIPGEPYTFGTLADAQAQGDLRALRAAGRRVSRVHLDSDGSSGVLELARAAARGETSL